jgi:hypothetical protein
MSFSKATAAEIDRKLRDDFRRRLKDYGVSAEATDPVLAVLFRTFAGQLEEQYNEVERIRLALLDELIAGLGIEKRRARPAQTVVRFGSDSGDQTVPAGTELVGEADGSEQMTLTTDVSLTVSASAITLAATYQEGCLRLLSAVEMPEKLQAARPSLEPVRVNLGASPAIFLAVENLSAGHLTGHSIFCELSQDALSIQKALLREAWCLAGPKGEFAVEGMLRPRRANAGTQALTWWRGEEPATASEEVEVATLPDGFYAGRVFVFPHIPPSRRFLCKIPKGLDAALSKIFGPSANQLFNSDRAWVRISMPREVSDLYTGVRSFTLHAVTASNVECYNQTIDFDRHGTSIPVSREAGTPRYLVAPLSVLGASGSAYLPEFEPCADPCVGRYGIRSGRVELRPARGPDGMPDSQVNLRLWVTAGSAGNRLGPNQVRALLKAGSFTGLRVSNPTAAAGGTDGETFQDAYARFAEALLSRDRNVTSADLVTATRALDRRILAVDVASGLDRSPQGLRRIEQVKVWLSRDDFVDPEEEGRVLRDELTHHLAQRALYDTELRVELAWK